MCFELPTLEGTALELDVERQKDAERGGGMEGGREGEACVERERFKGMWKVR
jgi:hypothetical protein